MTDPDDEVWEIVGGADKGGIIVRTEKELVSPQKLERLCTGALVKQVDLAGLRLRYLLLRGAGPMTGWVSIEASGRTLVARARAAVTAHGGTERPPSAVKALAVAAKARASRPSPPAQQTGSARSKCAPEVVPPSGDIVASLQYLVHDGRLPFNYMYQREDGGEQMHGRFEAMEVTIADGRNEAAQLSLDKHGVMLAPHFTALSTYDFYERPDKIWGEYYNEMRELVQRVTGASRVVVFDHNVRNPREMTWRRGVIGYVPYVHNDYTVESAPKRVRDVAKSSRSKGKAVDAARPGIAAFNDEPVVLEEEVEDLLQRRYVIINVWRNISEAPIAADPLAVADGRSIRDGDYIPADLIYRDRVGQTYSVTHDPAHRWLYFSGMGKGEAILLKCFDSSERPGLVRWTAHTGFIDPRSPEGAPVRESIDARCIAFFEDSDNERTAEPAAALFPGIFATVA
mmetsp:Transcript_29480/g.80931  ORF Transcript_29480/g.80931 Transcript_29480/m.80931 type:complete len:456 (-) Transcript_29480:25-1392(-)